MDWAIRVGWVLVEAVVATVASKVIVDLLDDEDDAEHGIEG